MASADAGSSMIMNRIIADGAPPPSTVGGCRPALHGRSVRTDADGTGQALRRRRPVRSMRAISRRLQERNGTAMSIRFFMATTAAAAVLMAAVPDAAGAASAPPAANASDPEA